MTHLMLRKACLALALSAPLLAACNVGDAVTTPDEFIRDVVDYAAWEPSQRLPESYVELITLEHIVRYSPTTARFGDDERSRLRSFLSQSRIGPKDQVALYGPRRDAGRHDPVTTARLQFLRGELALMGVPAKVPVGKLDDRSIDQISLVVSRPVVITPDCSQGAPTRGHRPQFVMGCATNANLGNMIANPLDLEVGQEPSPSDGEASTLGIQRYRADQIKAPQKEATN